MEKAVLQPGKRRAHACCHTKGPTRIVSLRWLFCPGFKGVANLTDCDVSPLSGKTVIEKGGTVTGYAAEIRRIRHIANGDGAYKAGLQKGLGVLALAQAPRMRIDKSGDVGQAIGTGIGKIERALPCRDGAARVRARNRGDKGPDLTWDSRLAQRKVEDGADVVGADMCGLDCAQGGAPACQTGKIEGRGFVREVWQKTEQGI